MPRIDAKQDFGGEYKGFAQSRPYSPIQAVDRSNEILRESERKVRDIQMLAKADARQGQLNQGIVAAQAGIANAQLRVNQATLNGLLQLSATALRGFQAMGDAHKADQEEQARRAEEDALLASIGFGGGGAPQQVDQGIAEDIAASNNQDVQITAEAQGISQVANPLAQSQNPTDNYIASELTKNSAYNQLSGIQGNAYAARSQHGIYMDEFIRNIPAEVLENMSPAQAQQVLMEANRSFLRASGLTDRGMIAKVLAPTMANNTLNASRALIKASTESRQAQAQVKFESTVNTLVDSGASPAEIWQGAAKEAAFGGSSVITGYSATNNMRAITGVLEQAAEDGNVDLIRGLRDVPKIPGQPNGPTLGKEYSHLFERYLTKAEKSQLSNYSHDQSLKTLGMKQAVEFYYNDPSPENKKAAIAKLREIGTEAALQEANRIMGPGLNIDPELPFELAQRAADGRPATNAELGAMLDQGLITPETYKQYAKTPKQQESDKAVTKKIASLRSTLDESILSTSPVPIPAGARTDSMKAQIALRRNVLESELAQIMQSEVAADPSLLQDEARFMDVTQKRLDGLLKQGKFQLDVDLKRGNVVDWKAPLTSKKNLSRITVSPGIQDFSKLEASEIFNTNVIPRSEIDPRKDRFVTRDQLNADVKATLSGGAVSKRSKEMAARLGLSTNAFLDAQLRGLGLPSIRALKDEGNTPDISGYTRGQRDIPNMQAGFRAIQSMGVPKRGAAYLASAIQHESGWNGLREWGQVAGDGTNRNGGLLSWASWANNSARLGKIERKFGKPIAQISESDQLSYVLDEMKTSYPDSYRVFMNPNATHAQLRRATWNFIRWDKRYTGNRWVDAERLAA
ncbi:internal virion protein [Synechococcus phage S-CBP42]|uniref:Internal virion protein n=1 Tax=Synechococcus phage S-CBP42 TaxID=461711 RepID=A0A096VKV6_9CAUD|nr:virion structural protein [Synechococcus phage S-CBP42]AGK86662.1 internal virion protein [Synechococcus phage S-CBP42]